MSTMRERQDKAAKEAFGHGGVGYGTMYPDLQCFIDKYLALEDKVVEQQADLDAVKMKCRNLQNALQELYEAD